MFKKDLLSIAVSVMISFSTHAGRYNSEFNTGTLLTEGKLPTSPVDRSRSRQERADDAYHLASNFLQRAGEEEKEMLNLLRHVKFPVEPFVFGPSKGLWVTPEGDFSPKVVDDVLSVRFFTHQLLISPIFGELGRLIEKKIREEPSLVDFVIVRLSQVRLGLGKVVATVYPLLEGFCIIAKRSMINKIFPAAEYTIPSAMCAALAPKRIYTGGDLINISAALNNLRCRGNDLTGKTVDQMVTAILPILDSTLRRDSTPAGEEQLVRYKEDPQIVRRVIEDIFFNDV